MVRGRAIPLKENSELVRVAEDRVTLAPVALSIPDKEVLVPTVTFPKLTEVGETNN